MILKAMFFLQNYYLFSRMLSFFWIKDYASCRQIYPIWLLNEKFENNNEIKIISFLYFM